MTIDRGKKGQIMRKSDELNFDALGNKTKRFS